MNILIVAAGYSIFNAKAQLNSFLTYLTEKNLTKKGNHIKISNLTKDTLGMNWELKKLLWAESIIYVTPLCDLIYQHP